MSMNPLPVITPTTACYPSHDEVARLYEYLVSYHHTWCCEPLDCETIVRVRSESLILTADMVAWDWVLHYATTDKVIPEYLFSQWVRDVFTSEQEMMRRRH